MISSRIERRSLQWWHYSSQKFNSRTIFNPMLQRFLLIVLTFYSLFWFFRSVSLVKSHIFMLSNRLPFNWHQVDQIRAYFEIYTLILSNTNHLFNSFFLFCFFFEFSIIEIQFNDLQSNSVNRKTENTS
jgi:uncharacterized membrane protein (DUF106 family)